MPEQTYSAVSKPESDALETLYEAMERAQKAFLAMQQHVADGGKVQRMGPGAWVVTRESEASE